MFACGVHDGGDSWEMTPGMVSNSTVDSCSASVYEAFQKNPSRFIREGGLGSDPRESPDDLMRAISAHFAAFFALRPHGRAHFSALDDEEFFVVEGSVWRGRRESDSQVFCHTNSMHALAFHG